MSLVWWDGAGEVGHTFLKGMSSRASNTTVSKRNSGVVVGALVDVVVGMG